MTGIKIRSSDYSAARSSSPSRLATASNDVVVGLDDDLLAIKYQLCGESPRLQVIPIVGMGGIGKTTLARNAYDDRYIREVFHIGGWVTVSQSYSVEEIISCLQQSLNPFDTKRLKQSHESASDVSELKSGADAIHESDENAATTAEFVEETAKKVFEKRPEESPAVQVYKTLKGRKYLIVMDDIWNTEVWDDLKKLFPDDGNGSRVMLTTRLLDVATYADVCNPYEMRLMREDQSWDLLRHKVFMDGIHHHHHELEDIGKAIARSCRGLPLAIVVIAGLLSTVEKTRASWEEIGEKVNSTVAAKDGQLEKILSLSYTHLPHHLRQCFAYMGGFPEDDKIPIAKLIMLWIAEGFVGGNTASKSLEEEAEECLQDLIKRSLVLVDKRKPHGEIKSCSLHDLMRDLCRRKANEEKFPLYDHGTLVESFRAGTSEDVRYPRVADWDPAGKELYVSIQEQIFGLSSLRYLVLECFKELPTAVSYLENLQTLIIYANGSLVRLPPEIWKMQQLRHLISSFDRLPCPQGATSSPLENLQTLSKVSNLECSYRFVKMIPNIKKLGLVYSANHDFSQVYHLDNLLCRNQLENWHDHALGNDYRLENLEWLHRLEKLKVQVYPGFRGILNPVFPQSLKKLSLSGWRSTSWRDMTIVGSLPNLQVLKLRGFGGQDESWETTEGEFARLSFLFIHTSDLRDWITQSEHFPNLKWLLLHYCWNLHEIPTDIGDIPTLELIEVKGSASLFKSARLIEEEQKDMGNDSLQVRCI